VAADPPDADTALRAMAAVQHRPREAIAIGRRVIAAAPPAGRRADGGRTGRRSTRSPPPSGPLVRAARADRLPAAVRHLRRAVGLAQRGGSAEVTAQARMSLGYVLANIGRTVPALREVTMALERLTGIDAGRARMQRGVVLHYCGRYDEAVRDYGAAVELALQEGDLLLEARARNNRGLLQAHRGVVRTGDDDLDRSATIFAKLGLDLAAADARWNIAIADAQRGDVPRALREFAEVERRYRELDVPRPALLLDRLEVLLSVPLVEEAEAVAATAVRQLAERGMASDLAEALVAQARVALLAGEPATAAAAAALARARFRRQGRTTWAEFARHVELRAAVATGTRSPALLTALRRNAGQLDRTGWPGPALASRLGAARVALDLGRSAQARSLLAVAARARRGGTAARRAQGWYAAALLRRQDGDRSATAAALRRGLAELDAHRAALGATELRASSGALGLDLAGEGLDLALETRRPAQVLAWAEAWRATALRMAPVSPPTDHGMAEAMAELRMVSTGLEDALLTGRPVQPLRRRQAGLEHRIRELSRTVDATGGVDPPPGIGPLAASLGPTVLVELLAHGDRLLAVVLRDGRATLHELGTVADAVRQLRLHRFALRRLVLLDHADREPAAGTGTGTSGAAGVAAGAVVTAARLDEQLFGPLRRRLADRPLLVVPIGALHAVAWSTLPTCAGRPVTVAPSAAVWRRAVGRPVPNGDPLLVAGPRLPAALTEVTALAEVFPDAVVLTGRRATAGAAIAAMNGSRLAHLAAHGAFR
jgi:tetratricopeptide (TPR) repeat protein